MDGLSGVLHSGAAGRLDSVATQTWDGVMRITNPRFGPIRVLVVLGLLLSVGCEREDTRLKNLTAGIAKDSALAVMGGTATDKSSFLVDAKLIEIFYYSKRGKTDSASRVLRNAAPLVIVEGKLTG